jgi:hypothetical protein
MIKGIGDRIPGDKILLTEEMIGLSEEKETKKGRTGDPRHMEMIEMKEESTRMVMIRLFRRAIRKEKYRTAISKRLNKKQRRPCSLSRG